MATKVYGTSDDLVEIEGEVRGEVGCYDSGVLLGFSDGTILAVRYGKSGLGGVWAVTPLREGDLFDRLEVCTDEDADPYSDVAHFRDGPLKAWAGRGMEAVR